MNLNSVPWLPGVEQLAASGYVTGASSRNWAGYGQHVKLDDVSDVQKALLTDPQTSGGLLVACAPGAVDEVLAVFRAEGFDRAAAIGTLEKGNGITVVERCAHGVRLLVGAMLAAFGSCFTRLSSSAGRESPLRRRSIC